jgi:hypothetical protein
MSFLGRLRGVVNGKALGRRLPSLIPRPVARFYSAHDRECKQSEGEEHELKAVREALEKHKPTGSAASLLIGFTCKVCSTRTHRTMSRRAYNHGIVLIECPGCESRHLIADNLGWFKDTPQAARKIEDMTASVGEIRRKLRAELGEEESQGLFEVLGDGSESNKG